MNKFLKLLIIPVSFLVVGTTNSCSFTPREIAMVTSVGDVNDGSFNQESYEACREFANDYDKTFDFYRPFNDSEFARLCAVKQAVSKGAKIIVLPGFQFAPVCMKAMKQYPNVHFLLLDSDVNNGQFPPEYEPPTANTCSVGFKCEYAGFMAGYAAATDLLKRDASSENGILPTYGYGYCGGMASSGTYEFGFGYIQGICQATANFCKMHNIAEPQLNIWYNYAQVFAQSDAATATMKGWLANDKLGIKVLFPCGGKLYQSATEAVQHYNKHQKDFNYDDWLSGKINPRSAARWIGVDSDQYKSVQYQHEQRSIYTSALKGLKTAVLCALKYHFDDKWNLIGGGINEHPQAKEEGRMSDTGKWVLGLDSMFGDEDPEVQPTDFVGIPYEEHDEETNVIRSFDKFTTDDYNTLRTKLISEDYPIYGGSGTDYEGCKGVGIPEDMEKTWKKKEGGKPFREEYLGNYQGNLTIQYI